MPQDRHYARWAYSDHKACVPLALCMHLTENGQLSRSSLNCQTINVGIFLGNKQRSGVEQAKEGRERKEGDL